jgi:hypothetical protein
VTRPGQRRRDRPGQGAQDLAASTQGARPPIPWVVPWAIPYGAYPGRGQQWNQPRLTGPQPFGTAWEIVMKPTHAIRRSAGILAAIAGALLASLTAAQAALAAPAPHHTARAPGQFPVLPAGWSKHPPLPAHLHTAAAGGLPGWQITLIAATAVVLAAALAVLLARARAARQRAAASPACP